MDLKLCYKTYPFKMNLAAMKQFHERTDKDLWFTLIAYLECYIENQHKAPLSLMRALYQCVDFITAAEALHALIKAEESSVELEQIQDGMFRCGWRPSDKDDDEFVQPYTLVLVDVVMKIDKQMKNAIDVKKKAQTG